MTDRNGSTTPPRDPGVLIIEDKSRYRITPQKPPVGCLWVGGIIVGVPAFIVWVKFVAVLVNWLMGG